MDEYIERQAALDAVRETFKRISTTAIRAMDSIKALPPADVAPVRHGKWINEYWHSEAVRKCSVCKVTQTVNVYNGKVMFNYCPYCGAKMDGERKG